MHAPLPDDVPIPAAPPRAVTFRAVTLGILCAATLCAITPYNDFKIAATYIAGTQFPLGALFVLFLLAILVNPILRKVAPLRVFTMGEMLVVWTLIIVPSGLPSSGMMRYFLPQIAAAQHYSTTTNNWQSKIWAENPPSLFLSDPADATAYFKGYLRGDEHIPWGSWATPLLTWGIPAILFFVATFCVCSLLRRQWIENEKFAFPLVTLPILLAEPPEPGRVVNALLRNPVLWTGFGITTVLHTIRGLHVMYPTVPDVPFVWNLMDFLTTMPFSQIGPIEAKIWPMVIGFAYLLPGEVGFSLWFFHVFYKLEILAAVQSNWPVPGPMSAYNYRAFHGLEAFGGAVALLLWTLWSARQHLRNVFAKAFGTERANEIDDSAELIGYRATVIGLVISYGGIASWLSFQGVSPILVATSMLMLTLALVVISWVVTQAGLLFMATPYATLDVLCEPLGTSIVKIPALYTNTRWENMFLYDTREMMAPSVLMGAKTGEAGGFRLRPLLWAMAGAVVVGIAVSLYASLHLPYYNGGGLSLNNLFTYDTAPKRPLNFLSGIAGVPRPPSIWSALHILGGFLGVGGLLLLRAVKSIGVHPVGFLCASVYSIHQLWFSIFLGWAFKAVVQRYGGMSGFRALLPIALGLILADVVNSVVWIVLGALTGSGYMVTPG